MPYYGQKPASWMGPVLFVAGICNLVASFAAFTRPFDFLPVPGSHPGLPAGLLAHPVHSLAVLSATLGLGFLIASIDAFRHWPLILIGLCGKLATSVLMALDISAGHLAPRAWWWITINDALWIGPLALMLLAKHESVVNRRRFCSPDIVRIALRKKTQYGVSLDEISRLGPVLVVFLRQTGCPFCRETLADLRVRRRQIEGEQTQLVLVHMGMETECSRLFTRYGLSDVPRISDPERSLYRAFGLGHVAWLEILAPRLWWRVCRAFFVGGHLPGRFSGDALQMPGAFLVFHGEIVRSFRHQYVADRPDYISLITGRNYAAPELREN